LKESVVGVSVFDREPGYDPKVDPIVRVHACRLREKLDAFYSSGGSHDIVIQIPKGGYVARFKEVDSRELAEAPPGADIPFDIAPVIKGRVDSTLRRPALLTSIAVAALAVAIALAGNTYRRDLAVAGVQPLVSLPGSAQDPAWGPDGAFIAFAWDG